MSEPYPEKHILPGDFVDGLPLVSRVELVTEEGRELVIQPASEVGVSVQDEGRTLKIFLKRGGNG